MKKQVQNTVRTIILMVLMVATAVVTANAQSVGDRFTSGQIKYEITSLSPNEVTVAINISPELTGEVTIPVTVEDGDGNTYTVTSIGFMGFYTCSALTQVNIPNSVTSIGDWAFCQCTNLSQINIPNSVTFIGDGAFYGCSALTQITIPNSVTSIGERAFCQCTNLSQINIPNSVTSYIHWKLDFCLLLCFNPNNHSKHC